MTKAELIKALEPFGDSTEVCFENEYGGFSDFNAAIGRAVFPNNEGRDYMGKYTPYCPKDDNESLLICCLEEL